MHAAAAQGRDVGRRGGVLPHLGVHRRRHHDRAAGGEQGVGEQVVGEAVGGPGQQVGGGRGDDDQVGLLADPDVRHLVDVVPDVGGRPGGRTARPRWARRRTPARRGGDDADVVAALGEQPQQLGDLVGGDAAADPEDDARAGGQPGGHGASGQVRPGQAWSIFSAVSRPALISRMRDRQRLLVHVGLDQRADVLEQALAELGVVGVDLARALGGVDDQAVLRVGRSRAARRSAGW